MDLRTLFKRQAREGKKKNVGCREVHVQLQLVCVWYVYLCLQVPVVIDEEEGDDFKTTAKSKTGAAERSKGRAEAGGGVARKRTRRRIMDSGEFYFVLEIALWSLEPL